MATTQWLHSTVHKQLTHYSCTGESQVNITIIDWLSTILLLAMLLLCSDRWGTVDSSERIRSGHQWVWFNWWRLYHCTVVSWEKSLLRRREGRVRVKMRTRGVRPWRSLWIDWGLSRYRTEWDRIKTMLTFCWSNTIKANIQTDTFRKFILNVQYY